MTSWMELKTRCHLQPEQQPQGDTSKRITHKNDGLNRGGGKKKGQKDKKKKGNRDWAQPGFEPAGLC
jgi:hypothetical protein